MPGCSLGPLALASCTSRACSPRRSTARPAGTEPATSAGACCAGATRSHHEAPVAVFILDEADRMTDAAANAMLKVLEEPQPGVVFVLVARSIEALVSTIPSRARTLAFASLPAAALAGPLASGRASDAMAAAAAVLAQADEAMAASKQRQAVELAEFEGTYGKGRGSGALRRRIETRHRRELRRVRFDAIRDALADLLGLYPDMPLLAAGGQVEHSSLAHPDRAATTARLAVAGEAGVGPAGPGAAGAPGTGGDAGGAAGAGRGAAGLGGAGPAAAIRAAAALEEADRRLAIGASPQLTLEAAFLSLQAALHGAPSEMARLTIR